MPARPSRLLVILAILVSCSTMKSETARTEVSRATAAMQATGQVTIANAFTLIGGHVDLLSSGALISSSNDQRVIEADVTSDARLGKLHTSVVYSGVNIPNGTSLDDFYVFGPVIARSAKLSADGEIVVLELIDVQLRKLPSGTIAKLTWTCVPGEANAKDDAQAVEEDLRPLGGVMTRPDLGQ